MHALPPKRYRQATVLGLLAATGLLALGIDRLANGATLLGTVSTLVGAMVAGGVLSLRVEGYEDPAPVLLLTREACPHCDEARAILEHLQDELGFDLWEVDITDDPELSRTYGTSVPVVMQREGQIASLSVRESALREALVPSSTSGSIMGTG